MDLKELKEDISRLQKERLTCDNRCISGQGRLGLINNQLGGMKQVVEAIDNSQFGCSSQDDTKLWWKIKKLLNFKTK